MLSNTVQPSLNFVNRSEELAEVENVLNKLTTPGKLLQKQILEFNGIGGIGKTALLYQIVGRCRERKHLRYAYIDIAEYRQDVHIDKQKVLWSIIDKLGLQEKIAGGRELEASVLYNQIVTFFRSLSHASNYSPIVIFFDSVDEIALADRNWLKALSEEIVRPNSILIVCASKISLEFENNPRVHSFQLKELDIEYSIRQLQLLSSKVPASDRDRWAKTIHKITSGHPLANQIVLTHTPIQQYDHDEILQKQYEIVKSLDDYVVNEKVFHGLSPEEKRRYTEILTPLSIPRMFNLVSMGKLIQKFAPDHAMVSSWHYSEYIRELQRETSFVRYSRAKSAYAVNPLLRKIFLLKLKGADPDLYKKINQFLVDTYQDWIPLARGTDKVKYFLELIYHLTCLDTKRQELKKAFKDFSGSIIEGLSEENQQNMKLQFTEEVERDTDLQDFFNNFPDLKNNIMNYF